MNSNGLVVTINELAINDGQSGFFLDGEIAGLGFPEIRTSSGLIGGQDGGYIGAQFFGMRPITLTGRAYSNDVVTTEDLRRQLQATLSPLAVELRITTYAGRRYLIYANVTKFDMPIDDSLNFAYFKIELLATDPVIYDDTAGAALSATINKAVPGGMFFSGTKPWFGKTTYFTPGAPNASISNDSTVATYPVIVFQGKLSDPVLTNRTTGEVWSMESYSVSAGSVTQVDMQAHTVRLGTTADLVDGRLPDGVGGSVFAYVSEGAEWWGIVPGVNEIELSTGSASDTQTGTLWWRPGLRGI